MQSKTRNAVSLLIFLTMVMGGGIVIGITTAPGAWYAGLTKPFFNPPNWIFAPVWTVLYLFIAIAGWRTWKRDRRSTTMKFWLGQMALNFFWSPLFFVEHRMDFALLTILLLLQAIILFIARAWHEDRLSAWLFVPYAAWVAFATALNGSLLFLNFGVQG